LALPVPSVVEPARAAPANALVSGRGLRLVGPGERFRATFRIGVAGGDASRP
jgi:hypothetical protein